jgi:hypothetical protein
VLSIKQLYLLVFLVCNKLTERTDTVVAELEDITWVKWAEVLVLLGPGETMTQVMTEEEADAELEDIDVKI